MRGGLLVRIVSSVALGLLLALGAPGCGGGGGGTDGGGNPPPTPTSAILFPPGVSLTNQTSLTVRGTTTASSEVAAVRVNGLLAASADGFATWSVTVPLALQANEIAVDLETQAGIVLPDTAKVTVHRSPVLLTNVSSLDSDLTANVAYVHDRFEGLVRYAPATSTWTVVSPEGPPSSAMPYSASGGAFDPSTDDYYQLYDGDLVRIDVQTGSRTSVNGTGPALGSRVEDVDVDGSGNAYVVGDFLGTTDEALMRVDLATGDRFVVSSPTVGSGTAFADPTAVDVPLGGTVAYVYDVGWDYLFQVDLATGARTVLLDASADLSISTLTAIGLVAEPGSSVAYLSHQGLVHRLDWSAGTVTPVFDRAGGHEDQLGDLTGLAAAPGARLLVIDLPSRTSGGWSGLSSLDLGTGVLTPRIDGALGSGPVSSLTDLEDVVVDAARGKLLLVDGDGYLLTLDLATGARAVFSSDTVGTGPPIGSSPDALVFDGVRTAYVGGGSEIHGVDVLTGQRRLVSDDVSAGSGPGFDTYGGLGWDPDAGRIVAGASVDDLLMRIDPATGDRAVFTTEVLYDLYDVDLDASRGRLYLATESFPGPHYQIDVAELATGVVAPFLDLDADPSDDLDSVETLASDADTGRLYVLESPGLIYELDATTAAPSFLADLFDATAGPAAQRCEGLAAAPRTGVVVVATEYGLLALDADTGERVLIAR